MRKKVVVLFTGGTISMKVDPRLAAAIPSMDSEEIMSMVMNVDELADIETHTFNRLPSPHMTTALLTELRQLVQHHAAREDVDGIVITHGTDTLEETAFYLDLSLDISKPIVITAAMRNASELGYDGPANLSAAICTAASDDAKDKGVLIVLNHEVNTARETTKTHTMSLNTFKSLEFGPLGIVDNDSVIFYRDAKSHQHIDVDTLASDVHLIKTTIGMDEKLIDFLIDSGANGLVIEAMGRGNVPPTIMPAIRRAIDSQIPVVIVSRCPTGRVLDSYGYEGGGKQLREAGAIFGSNLNGEKARIKLMLALAHTKDIAEVKRIVETEY